MSRSRLSERRRKRLVYRYGYADARLRGLTRKQARIHAKGLVKREVFA